MYLIISAGSFDNLQAFVNPDKSIVLVVENDTDEEKTITIKVGDKAIMPSLKPGTFNTFMLM